ncbi:hypothetical protein SS50377_27444 [Spironucleus salmonicida]|uniref:TNase-like domain-containing protein n=1 Tax=Spironucleus salmonicida TaxID=348837 RepID=V6LHU4_9EUKA|nr:hypothetical protein SS50377_27444 [Spironucleus salmonicida]|eukprot:EST43266.1 hypothetical protein SS50377_16930 [Spironucleus salmonicida]
MNPFISTITQVLNGNTILLQNGIQVILSGVQADNQIAAKEFLRKNTIGNQVSVTPIKQLSEKKIIATVILKNFDISVQLAKKGLGSPFGSGSQADAVKQAYIEKEQILYSVEDYTKNQSSSLQSFIKQNQQISGYIDYVISPEKVIFVTFIASKQIKFLAKPQDIISLNEQSISDINLFIQKQATLVPNFIENNIVTSLITYQGANNTSINLSDALVSKKNYSYVLKKEKGALIQGCHVISVFSSDQITVKINNQEEKFYFSSIYAPRVTKESVEDYAIESREFVRMQLFNKIVDIIIDYEKNDKKFVSVYINKKNFNIQYIQTGLVQLMKHSKSDLNRANNYEELLKIEPNKPEAPIKIKITDFQDQKIDEIKTKVAKFSGQKTKFQATVEQIISGSKYKCLLQLNQSTFYNIIINLAQVYVPQVKKFEKYSEEAQDFARDSLLYQKVTIIFSPNIEKHTNSVFSFIYLENILFNAQVVAKGLGKAQHDSIQEIQCAESEAKSKFLKLYEKQIENQRVSNGKIICKIIEFSDNCEVIMKKVDEKLPEIKAYERIAPKLHDFVAVLENGKFLRANILSVSPLLILQIDTGNKSIIGLDQVYKLEKQYFDEQKQVFGIQLACIIIHNNEIQAVKQLFQEQICGENLVVFVTNEGAFVMAPEVSKLNAQDSISGFLLEKGLAKIDENCSENDLLIDLGRIEGEAIQANRGLWKK